MSAACQQVGDKIAAAGSGGPGPRILTFGEALFTFKSSVSIPVPGGGDTASLCLRAIGGSELNVAVALARLGHDVEWTSVLPTGPLGDEVLVAARRAGVGVSMVPRRDGEIGTLHVVAGSKAPFYQRSHSVSVPSPPVAGALCGIFGRSG